MSLEGIREEMRHTVPGGQEPYRLKAYAETWIQRILDAIDAEHRAPDDWETHQLRSALGSILMHQHVAAANCAQLAMAPPSERAEDLRSTTDMAVPMRDFRDALAYVAGMPARNGG